MCGASRCLGPMPGCPLARAGLLPSLPAAPPRLCVATPGGSRQVPSLGQQCWPGPTRCTPLPLDCADYLTDGGGLPSSRLLSSPGAFAPSGSDTQGLQASGAVPSHPAWQRAGSVGPSVGSGSAAAAGGSAALLSTPAVAAGLEGGAKRRRVCEDSGTAHSLPPPGPPHMLHAQQQRQVSGDGAAAPPGATEAAQQLQLQRHGGEGVASPSDLPDSLADESAGFSGVARLAGSKRWRAFLRQERGSNTLRARIVMRRWTRLLMAAAPAAACSRCSATSMPLIALWGGPSTAGASHYVLQH